MGGVREGGLGGLVDFWRCVGVGSFKGPRFVLDSTRQRREARIFVRPGSGAFGAGQILSVLGRAVGNRGGSGLV